MIAGKIIRPSVNQPASSETFQPKKITNSPKPNRPNTIEGTPARFRMAMRMKPNKARVAAVFAQVNRALIPMTSATIIEPMTRSAVPTMHGQIPPAE